MSGTRREVHRIGDLPERQATPYVRYDHRPCLWLQVFEQLFCLICIKRIARIANKPGDTVHLVVHLLTDEARQFYRLDHLWADAEEIPVSQPGDGGTQAQAG